MVDKGDKIFSFCDNVDRYWFCNEISRLFFIAESKNETVIVRRKAARHIILLYKFFIFSLKREKLYTTDLIRDYYFDFQYIKYYNLTSEKTFSVENFESVLSKKEIVKEITTLLPKNNTKEEEYRSVVWNSYEFEKKSIEFIANPVLAKIFLLDALGVNDE